MTKGEDVTVSISIIILGQEIMKHMCHVSLTCLQYPLMKWSGKKLYPREKKQQSIKPSNDKYEIAMWSEYYFLSLRMLGRLLGWRGEAYLYVNGRLIIFICWQRGFEQVVRETRTLTQRRVRDIHRESGHQTAVFLSVLHPGPYDRGKK